MKQVLGRSKDQFRSVVDERQTAPEEYGQDRIKNASEGIACDTLDTSKKAVRKETAITVLRLELHMND